MLAWNAEGKEAVLATDADDEEEAVRVARDVVLFGPSAGGLSSVESTRVYAELVEQT